MVSIEQIVARIGQLPVGNPAAMRTYARRLDAEATAIAQRARAVTATIDGARYQSPAANRLRTQSAGTESSLVAAAQRLSTLAADIVAAASRVEAQQHSWHQEFQRVAQALERDARKV